MKIRVSLCIQKLAGLSGGAERVLIDLANELVARDCSVDIMTYEDTGGGPFYPLDPSVVVRNIKPFEERKRSREWRRSLVEPSIERVLSKTGRLLSRIPFVSRFLWKAKYNKMINRMRDFIDWHQPDVMIAFMPAMFPYVICARNRSLKKTRVIVSNHNLPEADFESLERWDVSRYDRSIRRKLLGNAEVVTVLLPEYRDWFHPAERKNIHVLGNAIYPLSGDLADIPRENVFISIGRLTKTKNHEELIRAFHKISNLIPEWKVKIFGEGPLESELRELIQELNLGDRVFLMGKSSQIPVELSKAKVMVLPSLHEGFPLVVGEAFAAGVPVIGFSDCSGVNRLVIPEVNGLLSEHVGDRVGYFASCMERLATDNRFRIELSKGAKDFALSGSYSPKVIFDNWLDLIKLAMDTNVKR